MTNPSRLTAMQRWIRLNPHICIRRDFEGQSQIAISFGEGAERDELLCNQPLFVAWLLGSIRPRREEEALQEIVGLLGCTEEEGQSIIVSCCEAGLLSASECRFAAEPSSDDPASTWIRRGWRDALHFHLAIRDLPFVPGDAAGWQTQLETLDDWIQDVNDNFDEPSPGPFKSLNGSTRLELPRPESPNSAPFFEVLHSRRSFRAFRNASASLEQLGALLLHSAHPTQMVELGAMGPHILRTTPSGGARHPVEVYPIVLNVDGLPPGVYHYAAEHHALEQLHVGDYSKELLDLTYQQRGMSGVAVAFFFTARWQRHMWKYRYARSYRMVLFDVAHMVQTHLLTATALGLRTFLTPALHDTESAKLLGILDDLEESVLYATAIG